MAFRTAQIPLTPVKPSAIKQHWEEDIAFLTRELVHTESLHEHSAAAAVPGMQHPAKLLEPRQSLPRFAC